MISGGSLQATERPPLSLVLWPVQAADRPPMLMTVIVAPRGASSKIAVWLLPPGIKLDAGGALSV